MKIEKESCPGIEPECAGSYPRSNHAQLREMCEIMYIIYNLYVGGEELLSKKEQIDGTRAESQQIVAQRLLS